MEDPMKDSHTRTPRQLSDCQFPGGHLPGEKVPGAVKTAWVTLLTLASAAFLVAIVALAIATVGLAVIIIGAAT